MDPDVLILNDPSIGVILGITWLKAILPRWFNQPVQFMRYSYEILGATDWVLQIYFFFNHFVIICLSFGIIIFTLSPANFWWNGRLVDFVGFPSSEILIMNLPTAKKWFWHSINHVNWSTGCCPRNRSNLKSMTNDAWMTKHLLGLASLFKLKTDSSEEEYHLQCGSSFQSNLWEISYKGFCLV